MWRRCWRCVPIKRQTHPFTQCSSSLYISQPGRIDGNPLHCDLHGDLWLLVKHWLFTIHLHETCMQETCPLWGGWSVFVLFTTLLQVSSAVLPDPKHLRVVHFLPFVPRCQNIIAAVLKWNKRIATLCITTQKQWPDGRNSLTGWTCC